MMDLKPKNGGREGEMEELKTVLEINPAGL
jgi:hypothetical protein